MMRSVAWALLGAGVVIGTVIDRPRDPPLWQAGGYKIIAGDFHVHGFPGDGSLPAWELRREAKRRGLGVIALTNHNHMYLPKMAPRDDALPIVLWGQEITAPAFHIAAVGITQVVDWNQPVADLIADVHAQGGAAIAAHPVRYFWPGFDETALRALDGTEVANTFEDRNTGEGREQFEFQQRARQVSPRMANIGSSDFHTSAPLGASRTYLLLNEVTRADIIATIREGRTVARNGKGELFGDSSHVALVRAAAESQTNAPDSWIQRLSVILVLLALVLLTILGPFAPSSSSTRELHRRSAP